MGTNTIEVPATADGMPGLTQGGYVAGLAAEGMEGRVRVWLRRPTAPGDRLRREVDGDEARLIRSGDELVAAARPSKLLVDRRPGPSSAAVDDALSRPLPHPIPFDTCLGCGTAAHSLGLIIRPVPDTNWTIGSWTPRADLGGDAGIVWSTWVWTVLDCVTSWAIFNHRPDDMSSRAVTGTIAYEALRPLRVGERVHFWSWLDHEDDRRLVLGGGLAVGDEIVGWADQELIRTSQGMDLAMFMPDPAA